MLVPSDRSIQGRISYLARPPSEIPPVLSHHIIAFFVIVLMASPIHSTGRVICHPIQGFMLCKAVNNFLSRGGLERFFVRVLERINRAVFQGFVPLATCGVEWTFVVIWAAIEVV